MTHPLDEAIAEAQRALDLDAKMVERIAQLGGKPTAKEIEERNAFFAKWTRIKAALLGARARDEDRRRILVWPFRSAPKHYRDLSGSGGDEDWLAFVPEDVARPAWTFEGGAFGCCDVYEHAVSGGTVLIGVHS